MKKTAKKPNAIWLIFHELLLFIINWANMRRFEGFNEELTPNNKDKIEVFEYCRGMLTKRTQVC